MAALSSSNPPGRSKRPEAGRQGLAEPHDGRAEQSPAPGANRSRREVDREVVRFERAVGATHVFQVAVKFDHAAAARPLVKAIDVLGDERPVPNHPGKLDQGHVAGIWRGFPERRTPGIVEAPDQLRVGSERLGRRHLFRAVTLPQPAGIAEGLQPALGRDAGAGQHGYPLHQAQSQRGS